ncbi:MAG TPA: glycine cleavage system aminomethyltransferase GcvT [Gammaproteobacteria bacterium]|nr:glycine cleavage system aminomethyltransferase GcvT [Gammaproteobacteria bacterium]
MGNKTPLYNEHINMSARMVDFAGWDMPIHYGSQIEEHHQVRNDAGMFDVSHMTVVDLRGVGATDFLRYLLANDVARLKQPGKALYSCMLNPAGGVIDDLIVYFIKPGWFRMVVNSSTREKDLSWIMQQSGDYDVQVIERTELAMIAVQGPNAAEKLKQVLGEPVASRIDELKTFFAIECGEYFIGRTGYTGEDGFEIILPNNQAADLWCALDKAGVAPVGLGARDTLRLEAGMNLYGSDMDEDTSPLEAGLSWTVAWKPDDRHFVGRESLEKLRETKPSRKLVGLVLQGKGVLRNHQKVIVSGVGEGEITSGSFSPTLGKAIAFASVPRESGVECSVDIRGKMLPAHIVKAPFIRNGRSCLPEEI